MPPTIRQFSINLGKFTGDLPRGIRDAMLDAARIAEKAARTEFIRTGGSLVLRNRLTHRSGRLGRSIFLIHPHRRGNEYIAGIGASAPYARIHERGGRTRAHLIFPVRAPRLVFFWPKVGKVVYRTKVRHPGSRIPARPFLRPAWEERGLPEFRKFLIAAIDGLGRRRLA